MKRLSQMTASCIVVALLSTSRGDSQSTQPAAETPLEVTAAFLLEHRDALPCGVTITGSVVQPAPGRRTAWIDLGESSGLRLDDSLLVQRQLPDRRVPIARARIRLIEYETALIALEPLVRNAHVEREDTVSLWPAPSDRSNGTLATYVLSVDAGDITTYVRVAGASEDGLAVGRLADLFRGDELVGVARVVEVAQPLSRAEMIGSATRLRPDVGDRFVLHPQPGSAGSPIRPVIFKVTEDNVCLLAVAEAEGIRVDDKLAVHRRIDGRNIEIAELTVYAVKEGYAAAYTRLLTPQGHLVEQWDLAEKRSDITAAPVQIGRVVAIDAAARTLVVEPTSAGLTCLAGSIVRWTAEQPENGRETSTGAAVVTHHDGQRVHCFMPPGWGDPRDAAGGDVEGRHPTRERTHPQ